MKHQKEFYILMTITIVIPSLILLGMWLFNAAIVYSWDNSTVNDTTATFTLKSKSYTENLSGTHIYGVSYLVNRSYLDEMEYGKRYSCNITKPLPFDLNNSFSDCTKL